MEDLHTLLPSILPELLKHGPLSNAKLGLAWRAAVGNSLARVTEVEVRGAKFASITVPDQHWYREVQRATDVILARLEVLLGPGVVTGLKVSIRPKNQERRTKN